MYNEFIRAASSYRRVRKLITPQPSSIPPLAANCCLFPNAYGGLTRLNWNRGAKGQPLSANLRQGRQQEPGPLQRLSGFGQSKSNASSVSGSTSSHSVCHWFAASTRWPPRTRATRKGLNLPDCSRISKRRRVPSAIGRGSASRTLRLERASTGAMQKRAVVRSGFPPASQGHCTQAFRSRVWGTNLPRNA
jgi:hypothetical protein